VAVNVGIEYSNLQSSGFQVPSARHKERMFLPTEDLQLLMHLRCMVMNVNISRSKQPYASPPIQEYKTEI
jgi:hypothetical protein